MWVTQFRHTSSHLYYTILTGYVPIYFVFPAISQVGENEPFVSELLTNLATTILDHEPHQIQIEPGQAITCTTICPFCAQC